MNDSFQKVFIAGLSVVSVIAVLGLFFPRSVETVVEKTIERITELGAAAGPDHFVHNRFFDNISVGGSVFATSSTASSYTLTTAELNRDRKISLISWTVNVNTTLTTMASTSAPLVGLRPGEFYSVLFYNASTTAASTATFAAGTGVDLQEDEGETVIVNGLEIARLTFLKKADTDVILWIEVGQVGD